MAGTSIVPFLLAALLLFSPSGAFPSERNVPERHGGTSEELSAGTPETAPAENPPPDSFERETDSGEEPFEEAAPAPSIADPLEPLNRALFVVNDKAYFWVLKPVARGYRAVVPEGIRLSVRNFFSNIGMPVRFVNNLLQGKIKNSGVELLRFAINTTAGIGGLFDPAKNEFHIEPRNEDLGQTFGKYGLGHGIYLVLPLLGPSSLRDGVGRAGDSFLDPVSYVGDTEVLIGARVFKVENEISLKIGEYEDLKQSAIDPYVAFRDAYIQYRAKKVRE
ncbi:MAG TPA: VacJ family lipoprotein [Candidatus Deferrimicrobiaceae bacterium]|nr:VacJ family lipoprotein [Candidatus Deferrimicrobiaceae bacterium]